MPSTEGLSVNTTTLVCDASIDLIDQEHLTMLVGPEPAEAGDLLDDLIALFREENEPHFDDLSQACTDSDTEAATKHIHFIAGSSGNMGLARLSTYCRAAESSLREGSTSACPELYTSIQGLYQSSIEAFNAYKG